MSGESETQNTGQPPEGGQTAPVQTPQQPVTPPPSPQGQQGSISAADGAALLGAINSLPEKIVNSIREATQPATPPPAPVQQEKPKKESGTDEGTKPPVKQETQPNQPRTLRDWWFN